MGQPVLRVSAGNLMLAALTVMVIWTLTIWSIVATLRLEAANQRIVLLDESLALHRTYEQQLLRYGAAGDRIQHACTNTLDNLLEQLGTTHGAIGQFVKAWRGDNIGGDPDGT